MKGVGPNAYSLEVDTLQLTQALKHLRKFERRAKLVLLKYDSETLTVSMGRTSRDVQATGTWPQAVSVARAWAEALAKEPFEAAITTLRQADGMLHARDFQVRCSIDPSTEESEAFVKREEDLSGAHRILARYKVTQQELGALINEADSAKASLWGPNDGRLIDDIALVWRQLVRHGVEPSEIRRLIDRKSRELWKSGHKSDADGYSPLARYNVTKREESALIGQADSAKATLWGPKDVRLIDDIVLAWKHLVTYGVEPSDIRRLIDRKSR
jgi:hypothetical protein